MTPVQDTADLISTAIRYARDSVMVTDAELELPGPRIVYVNDAYLTMTGYTRDELIGKTPRLLQGPLSERRVLDELKRTLQRGDDFVGRAVNYRKDGSQMLLEWQVSHVRDSAGVTTHYLAIQRDISQRNEAEQSLRETNERLLQALCELQEKKKEAIRHARLSAVGEMAAGAAHNLNNALLPVLSAIDLVSSSPKLSQEAANQIALARGGAEDAADIVRGLQRFCAGGTAHRAESTDLNALVKDVVQLARPKWGDQARKSGATISVELIAGDITSVVADGSELRQLLMNLLFNAVDAIQGPEGQIVLATQRVVGGVEITVSDTGVGMSEHEKERCLEPFFTTKEQGSGLGLSTCHGIARRHRGTLTVESELGRGSVFRLFLPSGEAVT